MPPIATVHPNGPAIRVFRERAGLTIVGLAAKAGVAQSAVYYYENEQKKPSLAALTRVADGLGVPVAAICRDKLPGDEVSDQESEPERESA